MTPTTIITSAKSAYNPNKQTKVKIEAPKIRLNFSENLSRDNKTVVLSYLDTRELCIASRCSKQFNDLISSNIPRVWKMVGESFSLPAIYWPTSDNNNPHSKTKVVANYKLIQKVNRTLEEFCVVNGPLLRPIAKLSGLSAQELRTKTVDPRNRFLSHTHAVIQAIAKKSIPREAYLPKLIEPLIEKIPQRVQDLLDLLFICGEDQNPHMLGAFIRPYCPYGEVRTGAIRSIVANGTLPDTASVDSLIDQYLRAPSAQWITECIGHLLGRGYKPNYQNLQKYVWMIHVAPLGLLKELIQATPEVDASPLAPTLVTLFTSVNWAHKRKDKPEDIATALSWFKPREDWTSIPHTARIFVEAAQTQCAQLMQALIDLGMKPDNSSTNKNTLSCAIAEKLPLEVISLLCSYNALPCQGTFDLVGKYSQDAHTQDTLWEMLFDQQQVLS